MTDEELTRALNKAFQLGQIYWQQADSHSYKQHAKSNDTLAMFKSLITDTLAVAELPKP